MPTKPKPEKSGPAGTITTMAIALLHPGLTPSTKDFQPDWNKDIEPLGPIGLLIESVVWHGMAVDGDLKLWQRNEPAIDLLNLPTKT